MVKLRVHVRVISEDAFSENLDSGKPVPAREEKAFKIIIREPSEWFVGALANEVKERYRNNYKHDLGQIKYLKDDENADLDPEYFVSDVLVDEGKAAQDGLDQQVTIKVIREQGRGIRMGSIIPDLTPAHYKPPLQNLPPVPKFNDVPTSLGKRNHDETLSSRLNGGVATKRQRLGQIEEEDAVHEHVVRSIEGNSGATPNETIIQDSQLSPTTERHALNYATIKLESPQLGYNFDNTAPATTDELEILPNAPIPSSRITPKQLPSQRQTIRDNHTTPQLNGRLKSRTPGASSIKHPLTSRVLQKDVNQQQTPITPVSAAPGRSTPSGPVFLLNSMKSASPTNKPPGSGSANKFRRPERDLYAQPESDIDDSQMSPNSRAIERIQPKLVSSAKNRKANHDSGLSQPATTAIGSEAGAESDHSSSARGGAGGKKKKKKRTRKSNTAQNGQSNLTPKGQQTGKTVKKITPSAGLKQKAFAALESEHASNSPMERDSPAMQLSESLKQSTPTAKRTIGIEAANNQPADRSTSESSDDGSESEATSAQATSLIQHGEETAGLKKQAGRKQDDNSRRCLTCWTKSSICDNAKPKCSACTKHKKNCQEYRLTRGEADKIRTDRKTQRQSSTPAPKPTSPTLAQPEEKMVDNVKDSGKEKQVTNTSALPKPATTEPVIIVNTAEDSRGGQKDKDRTEEPSPESAPAVAKSHPLLPPWLTEAEHNEILKDREGMTEETRRAKNQIPRTSALRRSTTRESDEEKSMTPKVDNVEKKVDQTVASAEARKSLPAKGKSAKSTAKPASSTVTGKVAPLPTNAAKPRTPLATGASAPFRSHNKKLASTAQSAHTSGTSTPILSQSKSLADLKKQLELNRLSSATATPTIAKRTTPTNLGQKATFNIDEDDDSDTDSEEDDAQAQSAVRKTTGKTESKTAKIPPGRPKQAQAMKTVGSSTSSDTDSTESD